MLILHIGDVEMYDSETNKFHNLKGGMFRFKHTLRSISMWEADNKMPFMTSNLTEDDLKSYYTYMCLDDGLTTRHIEGETYARLTDYISDPRTATVIHKTREGGVANTKTITSELIYSMMVAAGVPFEAEDWNINRLLVLLEVISIQNSPKEKMSRDDIYKQNRDLNAERKAKYNTKG